MDTATKRLLIAAPYGALGFWLASIEGLAMMDRPSAREANMLSLLLIAGVVALFGAAILALLRGRRWAWWLALVTGIGFATLHVGAAADPRFPLSWFANLCGLLTVAAAALGRGSFFKTSAASSAPAASPAGPSPARDLSSSPPLC